MEQAQKQNSKIYIYKDAKPFYRLKQLAFIFRAKPDANMQKTLIKFQIPLG